MARLDQNIKARWVNALRHEGYAQTKGALRRLKDKHADTPAGYCCLGVLACIEGVPHGLDINGEEYAVFDFTKYGTEFLHTGFSAKLGKGFMDHVGLDDATQDYLVSLNDSYGHSFASIADYIEENL